MDLKNKTILVTGAGGFIGSHLTEKLVSHGAKVKAMVHYNSMSNTGNLKFLPNDIKDSIELIFADITDPFYTSQIIKGCDVVFHLAALIAIPFSYVSPLSYFKTNVEGTLNVMQACRSNCVSKVIHTSTSECYGTALYTPIDELHQLQGQSPYSASKIGADKLVESLYRSFELPVATIRPFNTFGPRQSARAIIPTIISQILSGKNQIKLGSLSPIRDLNFIDDTVDGFLKIAESEQSVGQVINIGSGIGRSIGDILEIIQQCIGKKISVIEDPIRIRPEKSEVMNLVCSNKKAKDLVGWEQKHDIVESIQKTITFIKENLYLYNPEIYNV
jgi:NAD dependent epimerase/dehydratase